MAKLIDFSEAFLIAIHGVVVIAKNKMSNIKEVSALIGASENHVSKVLQRLVKNNVLKSVRGPEGGYMLARNPEDILLIDVYESVEGKLTSSDCPFAKTGCSFNKCVFGSAVKKAEETMSSYLTGNTVRDLLANKVM